MTELGVKLLNQSFVKIFLIEKAEVGTSWEETGGKKHRNTLQAHRNQFYLWCTKMKG